MSLTTWFCLVLLQLCLQSECWVAWFSESPWPLNSRAHCPQVQPHPQRSRRTQSWWAFRSKFPYPSWYPLPSPFRAGCGSSSRSGFGRVYCYRVPPCRRAAGGEDGSKQMEWEHYVTRDRSSERTLTQLHFLSLQLKSTPRKDLSIPDLTSWTHFSAHLEKVLKGFLSLIETHETKW